MDYKPVFKTSEGKTAILKVYDSLLEKWPVPYEELDIGTSYGNSHIIACGEVSSPPLVLLHGTSSNSTMWLGDIKQYAKHFRVFAMDIPGEPGKSQEKQYAWNSPAYGEWLDEVFVSLELKKAALTGISIGAWLAVKFAVRNPDKVESLVLLCPSGIGPQRPSFMFKAIALMLTGEKGLDRITRLVNGNQPVPEEVSSYMKLISSNFNLRFESVPIFSDDELRRLSMPVLLFAGEKDALLDSKKTVQRVLKVLPHAKAELLPGAGHVLINLTDKIIPFLEQSIK